VAPGLAHIPQDRGTNVVREFLEFPVRESVKIGRLNDPFEVLERALHRFTLA
jgi:hypothetical protein